MRRPAGPPAAGTTVPPALTRLAAGARVRPIWINELGGLTFAIGTDRYAKWSPRGGPDLGAEAERLAWAGAYTPVARVLDSGRDVDGEWLITSALPGESAVAPRWLADPEGAVVAIGHGLRALHDALPVDSCPFSWSLEERLARAQSHPAFADPPPVDRLVVCHGDACSPNTILDGDGTWIGHVDLGRLGVADRWADLAVGTYALGWNYGPGWDGVLLDAYGIAPDPDRTAFYRLLWEHDG